MLKMLKMLKKYLKIILQGSNVTIREVQEDDTQVPFLGTPALETEEW